MEKTRATLLSREFPANNRSTTCFLALNFVRATMMITGSWHSLGIEHVCADPAGNPHDWTLDILERHRDHLAGFGLSLDMIQLPLELACHRKAVQP